MDNSLFMQVEDAKSFITGRILQLADNKQAPNKVSAINEGCYSVPATPAVALEIQKFSLGCALYWAVAPQHAA